MKTVRITILGDIVPTSDRDIFIEGDADRLFSDLKNFTIGCDCVICNLEAPLTSATGKIEKSGPHLSAPQECMNAIRKLGITVASLANNHILDYGTQGVLDTIAACKTYHIDYVGAGNDMEAARTPLYVNTGDTVIGIMAVCDNECSAAGIHSSGANGYDELETMDWIQQCRGGCDYLVVLYHSGLEHYQYPSPMLQRRCRKMIEKGANIVVCQHSHCIGAAEKYMGGDILYGQGNTHFYREGKDEQWNTALLVTVELTDRISNVRYIPIAMNGSCVSVAKGEKGEAILSEFEKRSEQVTNQTFVAHQWRCWNQNRESVYYGFLLGFGRYRAKLNQLTGNLIGKLLLPSKKRTVLANIVRCESHRESMLEVLEKNRYESRGSL